ncbi:MAG: hypothetical protein AB7U61_04630 [Methylocystis sp.]
MKPEQDSPSRRNILATGAAAIGATAVAAPLAMAGAPSTNIDALWAEFSSLGPMIAAADAQVAAATDAMPAWAAPGPSCISADGSFTGAIVSWPLDTTVAPPEEPGAYRVVRVSSRELQSRFKLDQSMGCSDAKTIYVSRLRKLARLRMDQKIERERVGLPELELRLDALRDRRDDAAFAILGAVEASPNAVAAKIIIAALFNADKQTDPEIVTVDLGYLTSALTALQPSLTGKIALDVADLLKWGDS